ncbi:MAG: Lrp/AsnC ligand binding domain-containing protein [Nitrososphaerota archaeon]|nr:Lrp/AsnC ligand binding domain-containing protein [Nitrososphaerota archaeon]MDG6937838.1 Lrp/AsnC ligand binding domain-containing protein [Nitrososphaerota archaeon]MDG6952836.1 Lrp/AsnC ligand binding domain-containing protein [Nitrososphaerota archaeon]MDG6955990.1 Lrp/AsnC ligand binding domain-containing protein [Nitrososphaerota archaeon]MDG6957237.1 Lrp/AsnC ligand binding domain-containing protein [Nitrososphaerota archaeon]
MPVYQRAFVLLKVTPGHEEEVIDELMKVPEIVETHIVPGDWDILVVLNAQKEVLVPSDEKVYRLVMSKIQKVKHIEDTNTMVSQFSRIKKV